MGGVGRGKENAFRGNKWGISEKPTLVRIHGGVKMHRGYYFDKAGAAEMRTALKFAFVATLALIGAIYHKFQPKRRELPEDHWI
jgi:hypothetical protein